MSNDLRGTVDKMQLMQTVPMAICGDYETMRLDRRASDSRDGLQSNGDGAMGLGSTRTTSKARR
jgi:hypothetical protein